MNHRFYSKSKKEQNRIQIKIAIAAVSLNLLILVLCLLSGFYFFIFLFLIITLSIIAPFFDVPAMKKKGKLIYYSSLLITEKENKGTIIIHGGSLFDYIFVIDKSLSGKQRTNFILQKYVEGILNLIQACDENHNTSLRIKGTTYILNARTAEKIGLKITKTDFLQKLILTYNYVNILISNSIAKRKIAFPKLNNIKTFESNIEELIKRREFIESLNSKLKNTISKTT
ncbi:hypothetical protein [Lacinutrix sp. MEBiC02595]